MTQHPARLLIALTALLPAWLLLPAPAQAGASAPNAEPLPLPPPPPPGPPAPEPASDAAPPGPAALPGVGTPPPPPVLPPPLAVPVRPAEPVGPLHVAEDAPGTASEIPDGLRLTFGPNRTDLNPASAAALQAFAKAAPAGATLTVTAFAAGSPDDPSTPRRLALSRALTVRGILLTEGVPSPRILVRSLGASMPAIQAGPPDRADVTLGTGTRPAR